VKSSAGEFHARLILGADGRNSTVARLAGLMPPSRRCHRVAWQMTLPAPPGLDRHIYLQVFEEGYFGYCRFTEDQAVVSLVLDARRSHDPAAVVRRFLPELPEQEWLRMNPITRAPARVGRDRVWLIGDSARVMEPFTGEGMSFGMTTGLFAAEAACAALDQDRLTPALAGYARKHRALYTNGAWVNAFSRWILARPWHVTRIIRHVPFPRPVVAFLSQKIQLA
jgi:flavin-dependent dehydrogenase